MPTYEYVCRNCNHRFEVVQPITSEPLTKCEQCGGEIRRVLFPVGVVYKGTGFYTTDYARKNGSGGASAEKTSEKSSGESGSTETKKEGPAEKPSTSSGGSKD